MSELYLHLSYCFFSFAPWHVLYLIYCIGCINYSCHHGSVTSWEQTEVIFLLLFLVAWFILLLLLLDFLLVEISLTNETYEPTNLKIKSKDKKIACHVGSSPLPLGPMTLSLKYFEIHNIKYSFFSQSIWLFWRKHTSEAILRDLWKRYCDEKAAKWNRRAGNNIYTQLCESYKTIFPFNVFSNS